MSRSAMTRTLLAAGIVGSLLVAGCGPLSNLLGGSLTTVRLVNDGSYPITVELYIHDDQNVLESLITSVGERITVTVEAGESETITRDCDDLQAIIITDADLNVLGSIGPETDTGVYRDGSDFNCGDTLVFTFTHSLLLLDFDVSFSQQ